MKKVIMIAISAFLISGVAMAQDSTKTAKCDHKKECCKKGDKKCCKKGDKKECDKKATEKKAD